MTDADDDVRRRPRLRPDDTVDASQDAVISDYGVSFANRDGNLALLRGDRLERLGQVSPHAATLRGHGDAGAKVCKRELKILSRFLDRALRRPTRGRILVSMHHVLFSMRWWLALAFAGIAALTALAVSQVFTARSESAIRERAQELVAGAAVAAATHVPHDASIRDVRATTARFGQSRHVALFAFSEDGGLLTSGRAQGISVERLPNYGLLLATALDGRRRVETIDGGRLVTVALPLQRERTAALIAVASRSDLEDALGIVQDEILPAALWAVAIGAVVGFIIAWLITKRLRRIAAAAAEIERGSFNQELSPRFPDELGALAATIDRMRGRLRTSFDRLDAERGRLQRLLEQLEDGVIAVERSLNVGFANSRARLLVSRALAPGQPLPDPWPAVSLRRAVESLFEPGATPRRLRVHPSPQQTYQIGLLPPGAAADSALVVVSDVTSRERRERAEREFVTNAAHELRTPLSAISSAVEVLQQGAKDDVADRDRFLAIVARQTNRLTRLVRALLTLAHAQTQSGTIRLEAVPLAPLVDEIAAGVEEDRLYIDLCSDEVSVVGHRDLLRQALENLTANGLKHAAGQELTLRVTRVAADRVRIEVADRGPGMAPEALEKASDRFYRASGSDGDGFGLGLSIVRESVRVMNGRFDIDSKLGHGTTVSVELESAERSLASP